MTRMARMCAVGIECMLLALFRNVVELQSIKMSGHMDKWIKFYCLNS